MTLTSQEQHWTLEGNRTPSLKFWKNKKYFQLRIVYLAKLPIKREGTFLLIQDRSNRFISSFLLHNSVSFCEYTTVNHLIY